MIQSIDRAAKVLNLLQGARHLGISDLAAAMELPPSTVHGIVKALQAHKLVAQERIGNRYVLGPALVKLSSVYLDTLDVRARAIRWMHDLSRETGFASRLGVELFGDVLVIHHDGRPDGSEQMPETGASIPSHASAIGKVLLAFNSEHADDVFANPLRELTGYTITDAQELADDFMSVRKNLIAYENEEAVIGESSIAAPVCDSTGDVVAAVAIVIPSNETPVDEATLTRLIETARNISRDLGTPSWPPTPN
ncbi:IclR family transcriptional regulator [Schumannella soli]|uniref:IclR family transcriptional regulator n=1 Tax=Schumannella soli TaxID=2590779 RepID=A0A506XY76_9MICO|nr:IclR family transcriptional regulator [Schumannella soli]TPW77864.1 IclR family transcriptional regulator [Schumannella soli]